MKVAIDNGALKSGHKVRGIGVMVDQQIKAINDLSDRDIELEAIDFTKANLDKYDVVHYPYFFPYYESLPEKYPKAKVVVTVQDLIYLVFPERYPPGLSGRINFSKQKSRLKKADKIVTISETSKKDITKFLRIKSDRINVVYLAAKEVFREIKDKSSLIKTKKKYRLPDKFILYVGDINYNKNIVTLVKACENVNLNLVIVGKQATEIEKTGIILDKMEGPMDWVRYILNIPHPELEHYRELTEGVCNAKNIVRTGFVAEKELVDIYNLARVYCQPSLYEGFGLPLLEAMACHTPVVVSDIGAHNEIAGDAAEYFDADNYRELSHKLISITRSTKKREVLINKGVNRVKRYSWKRYAKEMIEIYKNVCDK